MTAKRVHRTLVCLASGGGSYAWHCVDCPAAKDGYHTVDAARRVSQIHADPARQPVTTPTN